MDFPTAHAFLRDRRRWRGVSAGVAVCEAAVGNADLVLARVPGPGSGKPVIASAPLPYVRQPSGIAAGPCDALFVADTANDRVLYVDGLCGEQVWLPARGAPWADAPGQFRQPRGLACGGQALLVADSGNARVQQLAFPRLEPNAAWAAWTRPVGVAVDSHRRVLVADGASGSVHRLRADGAPDLAFDAALAGSGRIAQPLFVACDAADRVLVADALRNEVLVFDAGGMFVRSLPGPAGWLPGALAAWGQRAYAADAASGRIVVFEQDAGSAAMVGTVDSWRGEVTALAATEAALYIKPGLDATYYRFESDAAYVSQGSITAGPLDAGEDRDWERVYADADTPPGTALAFEIAAADTDAAPAAADWRALPARDALLATFTGPARRFAWLRCTFATTDGQLTPRLRQAAVATAAEDYLDYLPLTYRYNDDGADGFLSRWLRLMRSELERVETLLDDMPRIADPQFASADALAWLAQWFGLELPQIADDAQRRALIARAVALLARRGTPASIAEFVQLHTGIAPAIVEGFAERRVWVLGQDSRLDFDTRLAPLDPLGMVVPDGALEQDCCSPQPAPPSGSGSACCGAPAATVSPPPPVTAIGRAVVGESGPLARDQIGLPLFAPEAWRFCVVVDAYRASDPATVQELTRIVEREKPAHTDWRLELVAPDMRVGFQARVGIDAIVGGDPPAFTLAGAQLSVTTALPPNDVARVGDAALDGSLTLT